MIAAASRATESASQQFTLNARLRSRRLLSDIMEWRKGHAVDGWWRPIKNCSEKALLLASQYGMEETDGDGNNFLLRSPVPAASMAFGRVCIMGPSHVFQS
jgi:hypothetical protein